MNHLVPGRRNGMISFPVLSGVWFVGAAHSANAVTLTSNTLCTPFLYLNTVKKKSHLLEKKEKGNLKICPNEIYILKRVVYI